MNPRPEVVVDMDRLALRHGCTDAELHAAIDALKRSTRKGRPKSEFYGPLEWGMFALVGIYGKNRFTAAKQILSLANGPVDQRENQARALVRRFDDSLKEGELPAVRDFYARSAADMRVVEFNDYWKRSALPWPHDLQSAIGPGD